jgi:transcriptional regulator with XRE-family HTH domain
MDLGQRIGRRIRALREARGLTGEELAYAGPPVGSKGYLSDIEAGKRVPSLLALQALADRLGVAVYDLLLDPEAAARDRLVDASREASPAQLDAALRALSDPR